jgi:hypothetical protein
MTVEFIEHFNRVSPWHNYDRFKAVVDGGHCIPLVVRAHRRTANMRQQLERLEKVARINETVLIVSHDSLEPDLIRLVANISFMAVKQIVNPHSANIWLDRFPGTDNATTPDRWDQFKHRRNNGVFPGMKHHFWWHLHHVWEHVVSPNVTDILMMEEDHVPTFDFYVALRSLVRSLPIMCPSCAGVVMGHHTNWGHTRRQGQSRCGARVHCARRPVLGVDGGAQCQRRLDNVAQHLSQAARTQPGVLLVWRLQLGRHARAFALQKPAPAALPLSDALAAPSQRSVWRSARLVGRTMCEIRGRRAPHCRRNARQTVSRHLQRVADSVQAGASPSQLHIAVDSRTTCASGGTWQTAIASTKGAAPF